MAGGLQFLSRLAAAALLATLTACAGGPAASLADADDQPGLPPAVAETRAAILEAARSGDIDRLLPVMQAYGAPRAGFGFAGDESPEVVLQYWKSNPDDPQGLFHLATLIEILEMNYGSEAYYDEGVFYGWPYFIYRELDQLSTREEMELYRLISPEYRQFMVEYGGYVGYRVGIDEDGTWSIFLAGD